MKPSARCARTNASKPASVATSCSASVQVDRRIVAGSRPARRQASSNAATRSATRRRDAVGGGPGELRERVPLVGVVRRQPQHPRPVRGDEQRDPGLLERLGFERRVVEPVVEARISRPFGAHQRDEDLDRLLEAVDALGRRRQVDAVAAVLVGVPAGAQAEDQPAATHVVDRHGLLGEDRGMPERVARDENPEPDPLRGRGDGGQQGPGLVHRPVGRACGRGQVVDQPGVVEAERLGLLEAREGLVPRPSGLAQEEPESDRQRGWRLHVPMMAQRARECASLGT